MIKFSCDGLSVAGEYWIQDAQSIEKQTLQTGGGPPQADAYVINGHPGPLYNCSKDGTESLNQKNTYNLTIFHCLICAIYRYSLFTS